MGKKGERREPADCFGFTDQGGIYGGCLEEDSGLVLGASGLCPDGVWLFFVPSQSV